MQERKDEEQPTKKNLAFLVISDSKDSENDEDTPLFVRRFNRLMKRGRFNNKQKRQLVTKD